MHTTERLRWRVRPPRPLLPLRQPHAPVALRVPRPASRGRGAPVLLRARHAALQHLGERGAAGHADAAECAQYRESGKPH